MECYEKGVLTEKETDGLKLEWGNYEAVLELVKKIAFREGFGDLLAEGSKRASEILRRGSEKYSMNIKGQELYEPLRTAIGWALGVIVSPTGGGHLRGAPLTEFMSLAPEEGEKFYGVKTAGDRKAYEGKAKLVVYHENFKAVVDCLGMCYLLTKWADPYLLDLRDLAMLFSAATGRDVTIRELIAVGEKISNIEKAFNVREGMTRDNDYPPKRFFEPIKSGPSKGECLDEKKFNRMLDNYYRLRGWDPKTGLPKKLKRSQKPKAEKGGAVTKSATD
jgi:aldehyde:ferredoxin oxidoreductase